MPEASRTQLVIDRLLSGETLAAQAVADEYGADKSFLRKVVAKMRTDGVRVDMIRLKGNDPASYYVPGAGASANGDAAGSVAGNGNGNGNGQHAAAVLPDERPPEKTAIARLARVGKKPAAAKKAAVATPAAVPKTVREPEPTPAPEPEPDTRSNFDRAVEIFLAGEHITAADLVDRLGTEAKPQLIAMVIARMKAKGYQFDYEVAGKLKRWYITGKTDPPPQTAWGAGAGKRARTGNGKGAKPRMPAPQIDAPTECVMSYRIDDDTVQFAIRQGGRTFTAEVLSVME